MVGRKISTTACGFVIVAALALLLLADGATALSNSGGGSWQYNKDITISNTASVLTDYQVLVSLTGNNFPADAQTSGADIRFTGAAGTELSYWIESWEYSSRNAKIWVKVPSIAAGATTTIRMYYGNPSASSSSNGEATFEFFDDASHDKSSSYVFRDLYHTGLSDASLTYDTFNKRYHITAQSSGNDDIIALTVSGKTFSNAEIFANFILPTNIGTNYQFGMVMRYSPTGVYYIKAVTGLSPHAILINKETNPPNWASAYPPISISYFSGDVITGSNSYAFTAGVYGSNLYAKLPLENKEITGSDNSFLDGEFGIIGYAGNSLDLYFNQIRIRKYTSSEPSVSLSAEPPTLKVPSLTLAKSASPSTINEGDTTTVTIRVDNSGGDAKSVRIADAIPDGFTLVSGTASQEYSILKGGEYRTFQYIMKATGTGRFITDLATVTYQDDNGNSYSGASNSATITVQAGTTGTTPSMVTPPDINKPAEKSAPGFEIIGAMFSIVILFLLKRENA